MRSSASQPGRPGERVRGTEREYVHDSFDQPHPVPPRRRGPAPERAAGSRPAAARGRSVPAPATRESKLRGSVAVLGVFLLTLAGCAVDSFVGTGLGMVTLVTLAAGTAVATLLVRRRDVLTVVVAPPLVFALVAIVNVSLAPSATLNLPTLATLLVRGFPTMAVATAVAVVLALVRLVTRR